MSDCVITKLTRDQLVEAVISCHNVHSIKTIRMLSHFAVLQVKGTHQIYKPLINRDSNLELFQKKTHEFPFNKLEQEIPSMVENMIESK